MLYKDKVAYLQAGGGIVFDSVEEDEYVETINKLGANVKTIETAERLHWEAQQQEEVSVSGKGEEMVQRGGERMKGHVDLAAG